MRGGEVIRQQGQQRLNEQNKNRSLQELQKLAAGGDQLAQQLLTAVQTGGMSYQDAFKTLISNKARAQVTGVQSSQFLPDLSGSVSLDRQGNLQVATVDGRNLTGEEATQFIAEANARHVENQRNIYQGRAQGTGEGKLEFASAIKQAESEGARKIIWIDEINKQRGNMQSTISNYDAALNALDNGASTGRVAALIPTITAQTALLDTAKKELGLDVIGSVTFGALSEGELNLAMDTALPSDQLSPEELRTWITERKEAKQKALVALTETAIYLSKPNTTYESYYTDFLGLTGSGNPTGNANTNADNDPWGIRND